MDPSSFTKTSFCGKTVDNVTKNELKEFILNDIKLKCGNLSYNSRYAKVYNEQYSRNLNNPHIICLKSSGTPYLLYCTQINNVNYCFLIDKKVKVGYDYPKIFVTPYQFDKSVFTGTLIETELVRDKNQNWFLLLGDIYFHKSANCSNQVIMERMNLIHTLLKTEYNPDSFCEVCPIQVKRYFDFKDKELIMNDFIPSLNYGTRGFYFIPLKSSYSKILYLFKEGDLQIKKEKKDTLNFLIKKTLKRDVYDLYLQGPNNIVKHGIACIPNLKCSQMLRLLFEETIDEKDLCVECRYNVKFEKWQPLHKSKEPMSKADDV
tara:strand:+ start:488 stop:1444 length:957 start_codon:yes stop_codon:yes gene_type:complete